MYKLIGVEFLYQGTSRKEFVIKHFEGKPNQTEIAEALVHYLKKNAKGKKKIPPRVDYTYLIELSEEEEILKQRLKEVKKVIENPGSIQAILYHREDRVGKVVYKIIVKET